MSMTKQLSLYERFCEVWTRLYADDEIREMLYGSDCKTMDEVETALKDYEHLKNRSKYIERLANELEEDKQKLADYEKKSKVLEIIKEHVVYDEMTNVLKADFQWWYEDKETQDLLKEEFGK